MSSKENIKNERIKRKTSRMRKLGDHQESYKEKEIIKK